MMRITYTFPCKYMVKDPSALGKPVLGASDVAKMVSQKGFDRMDRECFLSVLVDVKNRVLDVDFVSMGTLDGSLVHPREVFLNAVRSQAASVILVHNHPSGDPAPSAEDREVTRKLRSAGDVLGIPVLDHVILGCGGAYFSFRESAGW